LNAVGGADVPVEQFLKFRIVFTDGGAEVNSVGTLRVLLAFGDRVAHHNLAAQLGAALVADVLEDDGGILEHLLELAQLEGDGARLPVESVIDADREQGSDDEEEAVAEPRVCAIFASLVHRSVPSSVGPRPRGCGAGWNPVRKWIIVL